MIVSIDPSEFNGGNVVNVSIKNEYYEPIYKPFITEILWKKQLKYKVMESDFVGY